MAQIAKIVDIKKSFVITDPNAFSENMSVTTKEDSPEDALPILAYEGYNFLPTSYGYRSYFGTDNSVDITALASPCSEIFMYQTHDYKNKVIALCDDGIWTTEPSISGNVWTHDVTLSLPAVGTTLEWSYAIIQNIIYMYRQGGDKIYRTYYEPYTQTNAYNTQAPSLKSVAGGGVHAGGTYSVALASKDRNGVVSLPVSADSTLVVAANNRIQLTFPEVKAVSQYRVFIKRPSDSLWYYIDTSYAFTGCTVDPTDAGFTLYGASLPTASDPMISVSHAAGTISGFIPTFLNMAGQVGIFRANGRLGMWDSSNSVAWSSVVDLQDFVPTIETMVGNTTFKDVLGRIVTIVSQGDGFVIYSTKNIVGVRYSTTGSMLWEASSISNNSGIAYPYEVTTGQTDGEHFAYTNAGIKRVGSYNVLNKSHEFQTILPDVFDYLKESRQPVYLKTLEGRFLFFSLLDPSYIYGKVSFTTQNTQPYLIRLLINGNPWHYEALPVTIPGVTMSSVIDNVIADPFEETNHELIRWQIKVSVMDTVYNSALNNMGGPQYPGVVAQYTGTQDVGTFPTVWAPTPAWNIIQHDVVNPVGLYGDDVAVNVGRTAWSARIYNITNSADPDNSVKNWMYRQVAEWNLFSMNQNNLAGWILAMEDSVTVSRGFDSVYHAPTHTETSSYVDSMLMGGGPIELIRDTLHKKVYLRKYFTQKNDINEVETVDTVWEYRAASVIIPTIDLSYIPPVDTPWQMGTGHFANHQYTPPTVNDVFGITHYKNYPGLSGTSTLGMVNDYAAFLNTRIMMDAYVRVAYIEPSPPRYAGSSDVYYTPTATLEVVLNSDGSVWDTFTTSISTYVPDAYEKMETTAKHYTLSPTSGNYGYSQFVAKADTLDTGLISDGKIYVDPTASFSITGGAAGDATVVFPTDTTDGKFWFNGTSSLNAFDTNAGTFGGVPIDKAYTTTLPPITLPGYVLGTYPTDLNLGTATQVDLTIPGATWSIQSGSISPIHPTLEGALVFDMHLQKWGKFKGQHKLLLDYSPINSDIDGMYNFQNFGMNAGILKADGKISIFDWHPSDSWMRWGKMGYYRLGTITSEEVRVHFRTASTGTVGIECSMDGSLLDVNQMEYSTFSNTLNHVLFTNTTGRWASLIVKGIYDLQFLEFRGNISGRR